MCLLAFVYWQYVDDVLQFIQEFTVRIDGVGDVCRWDPLVNLHVNALKSSIYKPVLET